MKKQRPVSLPIDQLLSRKQDEEYMQTWTERIAEKELEAAAAALGSILIFRLGQENFGVCSSVINRVLEAGSVHSLPHTQGTFYKGVANIQGKLVLCVDLRNIVCISEASQEKKPKRMLLLEKDKLKFVFFVDEIIANAPLNPAELQNVPASLAKTQANIFKGILPWEGKDVSVLDEGLLFTLLHWKAS